MAEEDSRIVSELDDELLGLHVERWNDGCIVLETEDGALEFARLNVNNAAVAQLTLATFQRMLRLVQEDKD